MGAEVVVSVVAVAEEELTGGLVVLRVAVTARFQPLREGPSFPPDSLGTEKAAMYQASLPRSAPGFGTSVLGPPSPVTVSAAPVTETS